MSSINNFNGSTYVLLTAAKNEQPTVEITIESVLNQSTLPHLWIFVDDGSSDSTPEIVSKYSIQHPWIRLIKRKPSINRDFANVVRALNLAIQHVQNQNYTHIGILDADIRLPPDYYKSILAKFQEDPLLGLAGGAVIDVDSLNLDGTSKEEVAGAVQLFTRTAFQNILPLAEIPEGGWDAVTNSLIRYYKFKTRTFQQIKVDHLKPRNSANGNLLRRKWQYGVRDYALGNGIYFESFKCLYRCLEYPWIIGSILRYTAWAYSNFINRPRVLPDSTIQILENERNLRLKQLLFHQRRW